MPLTFPAFHKRPFAVAQAKSQASTPVARDYAIKEHFRTSSVGVPMPFVVRGDVGSPMDFDNGKPGPLSMIDEDPLAVSAPVDDLPTYNEKSEPDNRKSSKEQQRVCSMFDADDHAARESSVAKAAHTKHIIGAVLGFLLLIMANVTCIMGGLAIAQRAWPQMLPMDQRFLIRAGFIAGFLTSLPTGVFLAIAYVGLRNKRKDLAGQASLP